MVYDRDLKHIIFEHHEITVDIHFYYFQFLMLEHVIESCAFYYSGNFFGNWSCACSDKYSGIEFTRS